MTESLGRRIRGLRGEARRGAIEEVVSDWRASGQSQVEFCRELGIATVTLGRWVRELKASKPAGGVAPVFVEVAARQGQADGGYEVVFPQGIVVRLPRGFGEADVQRLLAMIPLAC